MSKQNLPHVHVHIDDIDDLAVYNAAKLPKGRAIIHVHINAKILFASDVTNFRPGYRDLALFIDEITPPDSEPSQSVERS